MKSSEKLINLAMKRLYIKRLTLYYDQEHLKIHHIYASQISIALVVNINKTLDAAIMKLGSVLRVILLGISITRFFLSTISSMKE